MTWLSSVNPKATFRTAAKGQLSPRRIRAAKVLLSLAALLICLLAVEAALRLVERIKLGDRAIQDKLIKDPVLGLRLAPNTAGHDANGFRNDTVPQSVDIVAIGDSQTWGVNVERQDAWPQQLARMSGSSTYNMALGGFGPVQYHALIPQALRLSPRTVIVSLYLGNDIYDAYRMAYQYEAHRRLRTSKAAHDLTIDTVGARADSLWNQEKQFHGSFGRSSFSGWSIWLRKHSALGRLINRTGLWPKSQNLDYEIDKRWATTYPDHGAVWEVPGQETVFTVAYRMTGLDIDEPRNAEGLRITKELLAEILTEVDTSKVRLMVLLVPTKEAVYATARSGKIDLNPSYEKLVQMEERIRSEIISTCQSNHIQVIDARPYLSSAIDRGERVYPMTTESHPNANGYFVIAAAVNENLGK